MSSVLGPLSRSLSITLSLPLPVSLHQSLCPSVSVSPYLPIPISLIKRLSSLPWDFRRGRGTSIWPKVKGLPIKFLLLLLITLLTLESCMLSCYLCTFFFFNLQVLAIDYYHAISWWAWSTSLSKCQHKDQKSSKFAAIRRGCKFAVS